MYRGLSIVAIASLSGATICNEIGLDEEECRG